MPAWISSYIQYKVWHEFTYPLPNFNDVAVKVFWNQWIISGHILPIMWLVIYAELKFINNNMGGPGNWFKDICIDTSMWWSSNIYKPGQPKSRLCLVIVLISDIKFLEKLAMCNCKFTIISRSRNWNSNISLYHCWKKCPSYAFIIQSKINRDLKNWDSERECRKHGSSRVMDGCLLTCMHLS